MYSTQSNPNSHSNTGRRHITHLAALLLTVALPVWGAPIQVTTTAATSGTDCALADAIATAHGFGSGLCSWDGVGDPVIELEEAIYDTAGVLPLIIAQDTVITIQGELFTTAATIERDDDENEDLKHRLFKVEGTLTLKDLTVTGEDSEFRLAAVRVAATGTLDVHRCHFDDNRSWKKGGAIQSFGSLIVQDSTFSGNSAKTGGAIYLGGGTADIYRSTFVGNSATEDGGAVLVAGAGDLTVENTTFSGNEADWGGALAVDDGTASVDMSTFKDNTSNIPGSAVAVTTTATASFERSALAGCDDCVPSAPALCDGVVTSNGNNASEDSSCGLTSPGDQQNIDLNLSALAENHGLFTAVHVPLCGPDDNCESPLVDHYTCEASAQVQDQRGWFSRNTNYQGLNTGPLCDVGAYESNCPIWAVKDTSREAHLFHYQTSSGPTSTKLLDSGGCPSQRFYFPNAGQAEDCRVEWNSPAATTLVFTDVIFIAETCPLDCLAEPGACAADPACVGSDPSGWMPASTPAGIGFDVPCDTDERPAYLIEYYHVDDPQTLLHWDPINEIDQ